MVEKGSAASISTMWSNSLERKDSEHRSCAWPEDTIQGQKEVRPSWSNNPIKLTAVLLQSVDHACSTRPVAPTRTAEMPTWRHTYSQCLNCPDLNWTQQPSTFCRCVNRLVANPQTNVPTSAARDSVHFVRGSNGDMHLCPPASVPFHTNLLAQSN